LGKKIIGLEPDLLTFAVKPMLPACLAAILAWPGFIDREPKSVDLAVVETLDGRLGLGLAVTGDAMFCQRDLSQQIIDAHGHYLWFVKDNQPTLLNDIKAAFAASVEAAFSP
jgi:hypothetical protein